MISFGPRAAEPQPLMFHVPRPDRNQVGILPQHESLTKMPAHFSSSRRRLGEGGCDSCLVHFIGENRFFNGRKHLVNVLAGHDHNRYENLLFY
jgi:hypothetical protein